MKYRLFSHFSLIALSVIVGFTLTTSVTAADRETNRTELSLEQAANLMQLPLACAETEYPNKLSQTLRSEEDLASPTDLHPAFYGCFDWHSAVHGHWSMVRLLKEFPDVVGNAQARAILQRHITPENVVKDIDYLRGNISWERPYGWAWLLKLVLELQDWNDPMAASLTTALEPLAEELS
ncbi:MAG: DUF2891 family protein, partial [Porticoccaceae bacterium]|nr:DUF2891 family protein [Porticoccaceae bacterium]MBT6421373.1 DUF2891 family protein [Porticoccaceae bacterium]MBT7566490.1 DUF2891 family protein [Porticoccaceae bacterium]